MEPRTPEDQFGLVGYQLDGKYNLEAVVARGGFGVVYRGVHAVLQTPVAVKVLRVPDDIGPSMRARFLSQFVEEARIVAQLQHPAIVRVTDFGVSTMHDGSQAPWMVLDWIEGQTLAADLNARRGRGGRSPREALDLLRPVIDALAMAHEAGIAHRDIKPGNIMLPAPPTVGRLRGATRTQGTGPVARVLDFGIAKIMGEGDDAPGSGATKTHSISPSFSPRYASPEQASGARTGPWTDVHALALVLSEMLTDTQPYPTGDKMELHLSIMSPQRPTPAKFGVDVGPWEPVLAKALALRPADRFTNASELLVALEASLPSVPSPPREIVPEVTASSVPVASVMPPVNPDTGPTFTPTERAAATRRAEGGRRVLAVAAALALLSIAVVAGVRARRPAEHAAASPPMHTAPATPSIAPTPSPVVPSAPAVADALAAEPDAAAPVAAAPVAAAPPTVAPASPVVAAPSPALPTAPSHGRTHGRTTPRARRDAGAGSERVRPE